MRTELSTHHIFVILDKFYPSPLWNPNLDGWLSCYISTCVHKHTPAHDPEKRIVGNLTHMYTIEHRWPLGFQYSTIHGLTWGTLACRVLVMEWVTGVKLSLLPPTEIQVLAKVGQEAFLTQLLDIGFFHGGVCHHCQCTVTRRHTWCLLYRCFHNFSYHFTGVVDVNSSVFCIWTLCKFGGWMQICVIEANHRFF